MDLPLATVHLPALKLRKRLLAGGFTDGEIAAELRRRELERLSRGTYSAPITTGDKYVVQHSRYVRRVLARALAAPASVVSHLSAAALYGLPLAHTSLDIVHLTRPGRDNGRRNDGACFHAARIDSTDIFTRSGIRLTSPARTLIDLGKTESLKNAVAIIDAAIQCDLVTSAELTAAVERASHGRGMPAARRALARADGRSESVGESFARLAFAGAGLPAPALQVTVRSADGRFLGRCDFGYPTYAVLIEFDGDVKYRRRRRPGENIEDVVMREKAREDALREAGFIVVRVVWSDLRDLDGLARRIRAAVALGQKAIAAGLVTGSCVAASPKPALSHTAL